MSEHIHNPALPVLSGWVTEPDRHLWGKCDDCGLRQLFLRLYDCFAAIGSNSGFWWVCADCLICDVSDFATAAGITRDAIAHYNGSTQVEVAPCPDDPPCGFVHRRVAKPEVSHAHPHQRPPDPYISLRDIGRASRDSRYVGRNPPNTKPVPVPPDLSRTDGRSPGRKPPPPGARPGPRPRR